MNNYEQMIITLLELDVDKSKIAEHMGLELDIIEEIVKSLNVNFPNSEFTCNSISTSCNGESIMNLSIKI